MDIVNSTCKDDGAGVIDCPVTRERMYADRLKRAREHTQRTESTEDPLPDDQMKIHTTITQCDAQRIDTTRTIDDGTERAHHATTDYDLHPRPGGKWLRTVPSCTDGTTLFVYR